MAHNDVLVDIQVIGDYLNSVYDKTCSIEVLVTSELDTNLMCGLYACNR